MSYLNYSDVRGIAIETFGLEHDDASTFMDWLEKQPNVDFYSEDQGTKLYSAGSVGQWLAKWQRRPILLGNAFSLNMVSGNTRIDISEIDVEDVKDIFSTRPIQSCVGHADTAAVISTLLGQEVPAVRATVALEEGDDMIVAQYSGPRLEEGTTTLPEGATIKWVTVKVIR